MNSTACYVAIALAFTPGCRTLPELASADLSSPGWQVRRGMATWRTAAAGPEIAGELLVAAHPRDGVVVQFSKSPLPLVSAQATPAGWQITFAPQNRSLRGRGAPSARWSWFQLAAALGGKTLPPPWSFELIGPDSWRLENPRTGEALEGYWENLTAPVCKGAVGSGELAGAQRAQWTGRVSTVRPHP